MIDDRTVELIHAGIDGELDDEGREALQQILAGSAEAREYQAQMQALDAFLDRVPNQEPPNRLHADIVGAIELPRRRSGGWLASFGRFPGFVRYGLATAAGLLLAVGMYEYRPGSGALDDFSMVTGTVLPGRNLEEIKLDEIRFELETLSSAVELLRRGDSIVLDFRIDASEPVSLAMEFPSQALQFDAITQMDSELDSIEIADHVIHINAQGRQHFAVILRHDSEDEAASLLINWSSASKVLQMKEFLIQ
jgi:hypothetical protein